MHTKPTTRFKTLICARPMLPLVGVHDALGMKLAQAAGFEAVISGGYSASATLLGEPDTAQLSFTEMRDYYARLCESAPLAVLADADTGFGGTVNVARTVRGYERAGVAGLILEDQVFPKRCGHFAGKQVVARAEFAAKLKAALDARTDPDLVIVARTDALAGHGMDEAIERMQMAQEVGADMLFIDALEDVPQMRRFCGETSGPHLVNLIEGGRTPQLDAKTLEDIGFAAVLHAIAPTFAAAFAIREVLITLRRDGSTRAVRERLLSFAEFNQLVGLPALRLRENALQAYGQRMAGPVEVSHDE